MSYLDQVGLVVLCVQTSTDNVSGSPVCVTPQWQRGIHWLRPVFHSVLSCVWNSSSFVVCVTFHWASTLLLNRYSKSTQWYERLEITEHVAVSANGTCQQVSWHTCESACLISRWPSSGEFIRLWSSSSQKGIAQIVGTSICLKKWNQGTKWWKDGEIYSITKSPTQPNTSILQTDNG